MGCRVSDHLKSVFAHILVSSLLVFLMLLLSGCATSEQPSGVAKQEEPPAKVPNLPDAPAAKPKIVPPALDEVQQAVKRVFKDSVIIDPKHKPNYLDGDFNGDFSQDLAVVLKPVPQKLSEINQEAPPWILRDLKVPARPGAAPPQVGEQDTLLAVIHGYGNDGWRDPQASQTFLLKNAVGAEMNVQSRNAFIAAHRDKKLPRVRGDLIGEVLTGTSGYLYFNDASYAWYDSKSFKPEPEPRLVHGTSALRLK
jgi:hypothetical protein